MRMPWGKYRGRELADVPEDYLLWALDNCQRVGPSLRRAIEERLGMIGERPSPAPPPTVPTDLDRVIRTWHRQMTMKYHPDRGGTTEQMQLVNEGAELLRKLAGLDRRVG
jgi:hypothetical protein